MSDIHGVVPAVITAYNDDLELDLENTGSVIDSLLNAGVHGIFVAGSTGEYTLLSIEERKRLIGYVAGRFSNRVPVLAGTGDSSTRVAVELSECAENYGASAVVVSLPHYPRPTETELCEHYRTISRNVGLPVFIYNWPEATGMDVRPEIVVQLAKEGVVQGIKDTHTDIRHTVEILRQVDESFTVMTGYEANFLPALCVGMAGTVCTAANVIAEELVRIYDLFRNGDLGGARELQFKLLPVIDLLLSHPAAVKEALTTLGFSPGPARPPILSIPPSTRKAMREALKALGRTTRPSSSAERLG